ncbi:hypothetical protein, partial [Escherichia coli]|uniref:hypothetical protein n=1 Tax=Escherichia coli TaxID=562 RepID=UPI001BC855B6
RRQRQMCIRDRNSCGYCFITAVCIDRLCVFCSNLKIILFGGYISNINIYQALTSRSGMESCVLPHN